MEQIPFGGIEFAENPEPRVPCVLLLDTSGSMQGEPIRELTAGLDAYRDAIVGDELAAKRVEVSVVTFGPVQTVCDFCSPSVFVPPHLQATGDTPMGQAIVHATEMIKARKVAYRAAGIAFYRPWIFMVTDGAPTDAWHDAAARVREGEAAKSFAFFAVGTGQADFDTLSKISVREPLRLKGMSFREMFLWLSASQQSVSKSTPGEEVPLTNPTAPGGWAQV